ncbi:hypothetical protein ACHMW6_05305 [Pseudoduganella sp. UC29_106]|uniref:hypothetical protein n=1 Tax=Pseudoduganella sp. UC29_106 TaxID=3374553 RepID=UPI00375705C7
MPSIENRSHFKVTVKHRDDLTKTFPHNRSKQAEDYVRSLEAQKLKPKLLRMDDQYAVRDRSVSRVGQTLIAKSMVEAELIKSHLENEHGSPLIFAPSSYTVSAHFTISVSVN